MSARIGLGQFDTVRTTVTLPASLVERTQALVERGIVPSRNAAIAVGLEALLDEIERQEIDRAFEAMAGDEAYRALNEALDNAFAESDWEALLIAESGEQGG